MNAADLMTKPAVTIGPNAPVAHAARLMYSKDLILGTFLCDPARFTVTVTDGIVTIKGTPENASFGRDIVSGARHVEGVVAVRDRLSYPSDAPLSPGPLF
ncbi:MAG: CBS domain-containing protein [Trebonia sp.]